MSFLLNLYAGWHRRNSFDAGHRRHRFSCNDARIDTFVGLLRLVCP